MLPVFTPSGGTKPKKKTARDTMKPMPATTQIPILLSPNTL